MRCFKSLTVFSHKNTGRGTHQQGCDISKTTDSNDKVSKILAKIVF